MSKVTLVTNWAGGDDVDATVELYCPSNGSEGMDFMARWCETCQNDSEESYCPIIRQTMVHKIYDVDYPNQWRYNDKGEAVCTGYTGKDKGPQARRNYAQLGFEL